MLLFWPLQNEAHGAAVEAALVGALLVAAAVVEAIRNTKTQIINRIIAKEKTKTINTIGGNIDSRIQSEPTTSIFVLNPFPNKPLLIFHLTLSNRKMHRGIPIKLVKQCKHKPI